MVKHIFIFLLSISAFISCKQDAKTVKEESIDETSKSEQTEKTKDGLTLLSGEFIFYEDAAVLQTGHEVYGVKIDDKMHELYKMGAQYRKEKTDGIKVVVRGEIIPLPTGEEGWPFSIRVKEIISVEALGKKANEVVKIGS